MSKGLNHSFPNHYWQNTQKFKLKTLCNSENIFETRVLFLNWVVFIFNLLTMTLPNYEVIHNRTVEKMTVKHG